MKAVKLDQPAEGDGATYVKGLGGASGPRGLGLGTVYPYAPTSITLPSIMVERKDLDLSRLPSLVIGRS